MNYFHIKNDSPILSQLPNNFKSAAILLHPFVQMPLGWETAKRERPYQYIYPSDEEILESGIPVSWGEVMNNSGLDSLKELGIALVHNALNKKYARLDLAEKLNSSVTSDFYYPTEDRISIFLIEDILDILRSQGANFLNYIETVEDRSGTLKITDIKPIEVADLAPAEIMLTDENTEFAFMSQYDEFTTLFLAKDEDITGIVKRMNCEAIICDNKTIATWYLQKD